MQRKKLQHSNLAFLTDSRSSLGVGSRSKCRRLSPLPPTIKPPAAVVIFSDDYQQMTTRTVCTELSPRMLETILVVVDRRPSSVDNHVLSNHGDDKDLPNSTTSEGQVFPAGFPMK